MTKAVTGPDLRPAGVVRAVTGRRVTVSPPSGYTPTMAEPTRVEILAWMQRTGGSPSAAVDHFWPGLGDTERVKRRAQVKQWAHRARASRQEEPPPAPSSRSRTSPQEPPARPAPASSAPGGDELPRVDFLRQQLAQLDRDIDLARATGQLRIAPQLDKRRSEVRAELDAALEPERRVLKPERTATAVSAEIVRRSKALELRAEIERRRGGAPCSPS